MATLKAYVTNIWSAQKTIYRKLSGGQSDDLKLMPFELRVAFLTVDVILGVILKALTDKGVLTDADLQAALTNATSASYPVQPVNTVRTDEDLGTVAPDPNLGA
jgi:hypothetical protein